MPELLYARQKQVNTPARLEQRLHSNSPAVSVTENRLIVPALGLDQQMYEGDNTSTLSKGLWHRPASSAPDKNSNTVIVGHRFTYSNPRGALYHLHKVRPGDSVGIIWKGKSYHYKVSSIGTVAASDGTVESSSTEPRLTIYTCTPLWLPKDRLVVVAKPEIEGSHE